MAFLERFAGVSSKVRYSEAPSFMESASSVSALRSAPEAFFPSNSVTLTLSPAISTTA